MIQNTTAIAGLSLAGEIMLGAFRAADNAGRAVKYWDNAVILDDKAALEKRPAVEGLLAEIRGRFAEYFRPDLPVLDAHRAIQEICAAVLVAADCYKKADVLAMRLADSGGLAVLRSGVTICGDMCADILNASVSFACYKIGNAIYTAANTNNVASILGQSIPAGEQSEIKSICDDAAAALEPIRVKYKLSFPTANDVEQAGALAEQYETDYLDVLQSIWKASGVDV